MDLGHAVDIARTVDRKVRHADHIVGDDRVRFAIHALCHQFAAELCVDLIDDIEDFRQQTAEQVDVPLFEGLDHDGMIRVAEHFLRDCERFFERETFFLQKPDQFGDRNGRMRVVQLNRDVLVEIGNRMILALIAEKDILQTGGGEEILLL